MTKVFYKKYFLIIYINTLKLWETNTRHTAQPIMNSVWGVICKPANRTKKTENHGRH
jgi:hypothetical protein